MTTTTTGTTPEIPKLRLKPTANPDHLLLQWDDPSAPFGNYSVSVPAKMARHLVACAGSFQTMVAITKSDLRDIVRVKRIELLCKELLDVLEVHNFSPHGGLLTLIEKCQIEGAGVDYDAVALDELIVRRAKRERAALVKARQLLKP